MIATGGLSYPKAGATALGHDIARQFGLAVTDTAPALVGFVLDERSQKECGALAGVSLPVKVSCNGVSFCDDMLFTHTGLSGPAILQASLYWTSGDPLIVDFVPGIDLLKWLKEKKRKGVRAEVKNILAGVLPRRFAQHISKDCLPSDPLLSQVSFHALEMLCRRVEHWQVVPAACGGYDKAEVTRGGVHTKELSSQTMESRKVPGLYFAGEVVDVTGRLGGYNLQWAWSSGWVAGQSV